MNPRIRQLADQAARYSAVMALPAGEPGDRLFVEQFAELIIQECIEQIQLSTARDPRDTPQYRQSVGHIHRIRQHFEIEEAVSTVITAEMVRRLREETDYSMMICKKALCVCAGDHEQAKQWLLNIRNHRS